MQMSSAETRRGVLVAGCCDAGCDAERLVLPRAPFVVFGMMRAQDEILFLTVRNHSFSLTQSADFWV